MLNLDFNKCPTILREISPIELPKLKHLVINSNGIESIEGLHWMFVPIMETINLSTPSYSRLQSTDQHPKPQKDAHPVEEGGDKFACSDVGGNNLKDRHLLVEVRFKEESVWLSPDMRPP